MRTYSDFFRTLHDETGPVGYLGQGTHYSVLRAVVFHDPMGTPLLQGRFADFAVIWDEDHDVRVMEPIEEVYRRGLLSSFLMFGEHKGVFTGILTNRVSSPFDPFNPAFLCRVSTLDFSVRTTNLLKNANIVYLGELVQRTEGELLRTPNAGRRSLDEVKEILLQWGLGLNMEVSGWPPPNVEELANKFEELGKEKGGEVYYWPPREEFINKFKELTKQDNRVAFLESKINELCQSLSDPWPSKVVTLASAGNPIISDENEKVSLYLKNLTMLWRLGIQVAKKHRRKLVAHEGGVAKAQLPVG
jgi:hypothetical protein